MSNSNKDTENNHEITFDKWGRMQYNPDYHPNHKKNWLMSDQKFLIENYESIGPEEVSFAIGRTIHTVMAKAWELRKKGLMAPAQPPGKRKIHTRIRATGAIK